MSFGRRSGGKRGFGTSSDSAAVLPWIIGGVCAIAGLGVVFAGLTLSATDPRVSFEQAALRLEVTDQVRTQLRMDFEKALLAMEEDLCEETYRNRAGKAAVRYYETLLEKPIISAGLEVSYHNRCQSRPRGTSHPLERIFATSGIGANLTLPWDCQPDRWRSPMDRALQMKLQWTINVGHLTSENLTGTLALLARSPKLSPIPNLCTRRQSYGHDRRPNLPLISTPTDDWDRTGRRRR